MGKTVAAANYKSLKSVFVIESGNVSLGLFVFSRGPGKRIRFGVSRLFSGVTIILKVQSSLTFFLIELESISTYLVSEPFFCKMAVNRNG
ncbi:MAG: hypothetical protein U5N58_12175 [Actinomycetota bacterium]|nr:hypothetical protein [Actinomycetota bacterium]